MDPSRERKDAAEQQGNKVLKRLALSGIELTEYENIVASDVIDAADLKTSWEDVGGLDVTIQTLQEAVVLPLTRPDLFPEGSSLMRVGSTLFNSDVAVVHAGPPCSTQTLPLFMWFVLVQLLPQLRHGYCSVLSCFLSHHRDTFSHWGVSFVVHAYRSADTFTRGAHTPLELCNFLFSHREVCCCMGLLDVARR